MVLFIALLWGGGCIRATDGGSLANKVMAAINEDEEDKKDPGPRATLSNLYGLHVGRCRSDLAYKLPIGPTYKFTNKLTHTDRIVLFFCIRIR